MAKVTTQSEIQKKYLEQLQGRSSVQRSLQDVINASQASAAQVSTPQVSATQAQLDETKKLYDYALAQNANLQNQINTLNSQKVSANYYTPRSDEELKSIATTEKQAYYDQLRTSAKQKYDREKLSLENQKAGLGASYDKQREEAKRQNLQSYSQADRQMLSRGMQRSSYGAATLANISLEGERTQNNISEQQRTAEGNIDAQIQQYEAQLADALASYDTQQAADIQARLNELKAEEYDRKREAAQYEQSLLAQQEQMNLEKEKFDYTKTSDDRQIAYGIATAILANGGDPSDDVLARAGLSRADANAMKAQAAEATESVVGGTYTPKPTPTPEEKPNYDEYKKNLETKKQEKAKEQSINGKVVKGGTGNSTIARVTK